MTKADKEGQRKTPILRFKGFTDDWEQRKLNEATTRILRKNKNLISKRPLTISAQYGLIDQQAFFNKQVASSNLENYLLLEKGEFAYNKSYSDGFPYGTIKKLNLYDNGAVSTLYIAFKANADINSDFLENLFSSNKWNNEVYKIAAEGARNHGLLNISPDDFFNIKITISKDSQEQAFISKFLRVFDNLLALYEMKKQLLTQLKQGIVNFLITKNGQKPQLRFSGFNNNWESKSFEKLLNYEQPTKYIVKKADYISQGTPVLTANKSFVLGYTNETNVYQSIPAIIFDDFTLESKYVDFPFMVKSSAIKILTSKNSNLFFIYQLLNNQKFVQEGHSRHYISVVQKKKVLVPSIQEQNKIGNLIKQLENSIEQNSNTITLLKRLKEFLLQNMFL